MKQTAHSLYLNNFGLYFGGGRMVPNASEIAVSKIEVKEEDNATQTSLPLNNEQLVALNIAITDALSADKNKALKAKGDLAYLGVKLDETSATTKDAVAHALKGIYDALASKAEGEEKATLLKANKNALELYVSREILRRKVGAHLSTGIPKYYSGLGSVMTILTYLHGLCVAGAAIYLVADSTLMLFGKAVALSAPLMLAAGLVSYGAHKWLGEKKSLPDSYAISAIVGLGSIIAVYATTQLFSTALLYRLLAGGIGGMVAGGLAAMHSIGSRKIGPHLEDIATSFVSDLGKTPGEALNYTFTPKGEGFAWNKTKDSITLVLGLGVGAGLGAGIAYAAPMATAAIVQATGWYLTPHLELMVTYTTAWSMALVVGTLVGMARYGVEPRNSDGYEKVE